MSILSFRRASAVNPGKHGPDDWKVMLASVAPEHAELLFMLGMALIAEDRYNEPWQRGRYKLWDYVASLREAREPQRVLEIANACHASIQNSPRKLAERQQLLFDESM